MEFAMFLSIVTGQLCLFSYWLMAGIWGFPSVFSIPFKKCPEASDCLWDFPSGFPIPLCPAPVQQPLRSFPAVTSKNMAISKPFLYRAAFLLILIKS
jgi:hypothetical protein